MDTEIKYAEKQEQIKIELATLKEKLDRHKLAYKKNPAFWGRVGDLSYILKQLKEINKFLNV